MKKSIISAAFSTVFSILISSAAYSADVNSFTQADAFDGDCPSTSAPLQLDRSGLDKASVHLQILQQANSHPAESPKKSSDSKKTLNKNQSNS